MCVLTFAWHAHPKWQLVLAGNRDEFHARPAAPLARWEGTGSIIAGRDLEAGGTWLGISDAGRLAVVTNRRSIPQPSPNLFSRGALVADLLAGSGPHADIDDVDLSRFNPFNLIFVKAGKARHLTNQPSPMHADMAPGIYGLSNGDLDEPWPKTLQLKAHLHRWLTDGDDDVSPLFAALANRSLGHADAVSSGRTDTTKDPRLSPVFIQNPAYGTRCSTIVLVGASGEGQIIERRFSPAGEATGETALSFRWPA